MTRRNTAYTHIIEQLLLDQFINKILHNTSDLKSKVAEQFTDLEISDTINTSAMQSK